MSDYVFVVECSNPMLHHSYLIGDGSQKNKTKRTKIENVALVARNIVCELKANALITVLLLCGDKAVNLGQYTKNEFLKSNPLDAKNAIGIYYDKNAVYGEDSFWKHCPDSYNGAICDAANILKNNGKKSAIVVFASMKVHDYYEEENYNALRQSLKDKGIKLYFLSFGLGLAAKDPNLYHDFYVQHDENIVYLFSGNEPADMCNQECVIAAKSIAAFSDLYVTYRDMIKNNEHAIDIFERSPVPDNHENPPTEKPEKNPPVIPAEPKPDDANKPRLPEESTLPKKQITTESNKPNPKRDIHDLGDTEPNSSDTESSTESSTDYSDYSDAGDFSDEIDIIKDGVYIKIKNKK